MKIHRHWRKALILLLLWAGGIVLATLYSTTVVDATRQDHYRWRNDDGSETSATFAAGQDAPLSAVAPGTAARLRLGVSNSGSESELLRKATLALHEPALAHSIGTSVIDTANGFAYFGTLTSPGQIIKVDLSTFTEVDVLTLQTGEDQISSSVIDTANGFAYFGTGVFGADPGIIIKINLSTFTEAGSLTLNNSSESWLLSAVIDPANGFAYFGNAANSEPGLVIKIDLATFTEVSALTLDPGPLGLRSAVIDIGNGFAYFGTSGAPGVVYKINLSSFTAVGSLTLNDVSEAALYSAVIDTSNGFAYFTTGNTPSLVIKINLASFTEVDTLTLTGDSQNERSAFIDSAHGFAYFSVSQSDPDPDLIDKIDLSTFTEVASLTLQSGDRNITAVAFDPGSGMAYFGTYTVPGTVIKVDLSDFSRKGSLVLRGPSGTPSVGVIDALHGYAYFGTADSPARIIKIRLSDFTVQRVLVLASGENSARTAVIDPTNGFAYFVMQTSPGIIVKINLASFTEVDSLTLQSGENSPLSAVFDPDHGFVYVGLATDPGSVAKINLASFTETGALSFDPGESFALSAAIDPTNGFAYFGTFTDPGIVVKVNLSSFTRAGAVTLQTGEPYLYSAAIDPTNGFAYFGTYSNPGIVAKIDLGSFTEAGAITFNSGQGPLTAAIADPPNGFAYFGTNTNPGNIVKVDLGSFTVSDTLTLNSGESIVTAVVGPIDGLFYIGLGTTPDSFIKISTAPRIRPRLEYGVKTSSCAAVSPWVQVPAAGAPTSEAWQMALSPNVADGTATTDNAGLPNGNNSFAAGFVQEATSEVPSSIALGEKQFTELEFSLQATSHVSDHDAYCFRLTDAGDPGPFVYTTYAEATYGAVPPAAGGISTSQTPIESSTTTTSSTNTEQTTSPALMGLQTSIRHGVNATSLDFSGDQPTPAPGDTVTYRIDVTNPTRGEIRNVRLSNVIPPTSSYVSPSLTVNGVLVSDTSASDQTFYDQATRTAHFMLGDLSPGENSYVGLKVLVGSGTSTLVDQVRIEADAVASSTLQYAVSVKQTTVSKPPPKPPTPPLETETTSPADPSPEPTAPVTASPGETEQAPSSETPTAGTTENGSSQPSVSLTTGLGVSENSVDFFARSPETLAATPVLDAFIDTTKNLPRVQGAMIATRTFIKDVRTSEAVQTANNIVVTPVAAAATTTAATTAIGFSGLLRYGLFLLTQPLALRDRRKKKAYGIVYNLGTKLPVALAIVRLIDVQNNKIAATRVTDHDGRYLFIVPPGTYRLEVRKEGYRFPALRSIDAADGPYRDLLIDGNITTKDGIIDKNVPVDPIGDIRSNQKVLADARVSHFQGGMMLIGSGITAASYIVTPRWEQIAAFFIQFAFLFLFVRLTRPAHPKKYGTVRTGAGAPVRQAVVRVVESAYNKTLDSQITDARGRYAFLVGQNRYFVTGEKKGYEPIRTDILDFTKSAEPSVITQDLTIKPLSAP